MKPTYDFSWMCCLVIDDCHSVSQYLQVVLQDSLNLKEVYVVHSANEALNFLDENPVIHVVLCDLNMEQVDGLEMIRLLKEKRFRGYFGIISSMASKVINSAEQLAKVHNINLLGSIAKPVSEEDLIQLLSGVGEKQLSFDQAKPSSTPLKIYELIRGIEKEQFEIYYQPKINTLTRKIVGVEALTRLNHPRQGIMPPDSFIAAMEHTTLINALTQYVMKHALKHWKEWQSNGHTLNLAINISPQELNNLDLPEYLLGLLQEHDVPASNITLEVTESALDLNQADALEVLNRLSMHGIRLSIDDFGTGHSSLERLRIYPFDELKIDKSFMLNARKSDNDRAIVESSVILAKRLGLQVVFEGIETSELYQMSNHLGGDIIQGYFMSKPIKESDLLGWIDQWNQQNS